MIPALYSLSFAAHGQTPLRGEALLTDLSRRAVNYFWEESNPNTGFARDRAPIHEGTGRRNENISSVASTGYALSAYCIGVDRKWLNRTEAKKRTITTLKAIYDKSEGHNGWYYHFTNWETGKREWNSELSSIDSGLLFAGIHMAEGYWKDPEVTKLARQIMARVDWKWFLTDGGKKPNSLTFSMGWSPDGGFLESRWDGFYEHMFLYVIALGNDQKLEPEIWTAFRRSKFTYQGIEVLHGAALFIHQMSQAYLPMKGKRDVLGYDYWVEGRNMTLASHLYTKTNPKKFKAYGPDIWGLSACDIPGGYGAPGAPVPPGEEPFDNGTLAPAAAVASVMYTPDLSIKAANAFVTQFPQCYGKFGFTTGINPTENWMSPDVIGIDIGQMMLAIEAHQNGKPHQWMMANSAISKGMSRAGFRTTSEGPLDKRPLYKQPY